MKRTPCSALALMLCILAAGLIASPGLVGQDTRPAPVHSPVKRPFPPARDAAQFTQWYIDARASLLGHLKAAKARGDRDEVSRTIARMQAVRHHVVMELRRLEKGRQKMPKPLGETPAKPASRPATPGS